MVSIRELNRIMYIFYYPILDVALWGFMSLWMQQSSTDTNIVMIYLAAIVMWSVVWTVEMELTINMHEELESRNVVNLFSTPLTLSEWLSGNIILAIIKSFGVFLLSSSMAYLFFGVNVFNLGIKLLPLLILMITSGFVMGIFLTGILIRGGQQIAILIWSIPYLILTLSAPFFSVDVLPRWIQPIVKAFPTTHIFESLRHLIAHGTLPYKGIFMSTMLNIIYIFAAVFFIFYMFKKSKEHGLAQLEQE